METYAETGLVRFEYKHFAFIGQESVRAALAAECANEQGKFWEYHDMLFANQQGENQGAFSDDRLMAFAEAIGLDMDQFRSCYRSGKYADVVEAERREGQAMGVRSTPTIFVNGQMIEGAQPFEVFQEIIEAELAK